MTVDELTKVLQRHSPSAEVIVTSYGKELNFNIGQTTDGDVLIDTWDED